MDPTPISTYLTRRMRFLLPAIVSALALVACRLAAAEPSTPVLPVPTQTPLVIVVTATAQPATLPVLPPAASPAFTSPTLAAPTILPQLPATITPTHAFPPAGPTPSHPSSLRLKMYLVAIGDNGVSGPLLGCGDSLIPVNIDVPYTQGVLRAALDYLLAQNDRYFGQSGLYNALYASDLKVSGVNIKNGEAIIQLSGQAQLGGECDTPRLIGQLEATALQFSTVDRVTITLNGVEIHEALTLR